MSKTLLNTDILQNENVEKDNNLKIGLLWKYIKDIC